MGRSKKWNNAAEKQKAWRLREAAKSSQEGGGEVNPLAVLLQRLRTNQGRWNKKYDCEEVDRLDYPGQIGYLYLVRRNGTDSYCVIRRYFDRVSCGNTFSPCKFTGLEKAMETLQEFVSGNISEEWEQVDSYIRRAKRFLLQYREDHKVDFASRYPNRLGFFMAVCEMKEMGFSEEGFELYEGFKSGQTEKHLSQLKTTRRNVLAEIGNELIPPDIDREGLRKLFEKWFYIIARSPTGPDGSVSECNFDLRCRSIISSFSIFSKDFPAAFSHIQNIAETANYVMNKVKEASWVTVERSDGIRKGSNYPYCKIEDLKVILDKAWGLASKEAYYSMVLDLTTALRVEEVHRLIENPDRYILDNGKLNYKGIGLSPSEYLVQKTAKKVPVKNHKNPVLSPVARLILFHQEFWDSKKIMKGFFDPKKKFSFRNIKSDLDHYVQKSLRETAGHMLAYCDNASYGRATRDDVKERMAHKDTSEAEKIYAKDRPSDELPEIYFNISEEIIIKGVNIVSHSPLWDTWLLLDYIERLRDEFGFESTEYSDFQDLCVDEILKYRRFKGVKDGNATPSPRKV